MGAEGKRISGFGKRFLFYSKQWGVMEGLAGECMLPFLSAGSLSGYS